ncbi:MAG: PAS domain S-box protein [Dehalococcoidia bacterium]
MRSVKGRRRASTVGAEPIALSPEGKRLVHALLTHATDAMIVVDSATGRIVDVNERTVALYGYSREEFRSFPAGWDLRTPEEGAAGERLFQAYARTGQLPARVRRHQRKDGATLPVEVTITRIEIDGRTLLVATLRDLREQFAIQEERDRLHAETVRWAREVEILLDATAALNAAHDPESAIRAIAERAALLCQAEIASVGMRQDEELVIDRLRIGGDWTRIEYKLPARGSIISRVIASGRPYRSDDLAKDRYSDHMWDARHGFRTQLSVPLVGSERQVLGVVSLYNKTDGPFTEGDQAAIEALAAQGAIALERILSREALAESHEALARSEERFRSLVQNVSDIITLIGADGAIRYQSPAIRDVLGYEADELVGRYAVEFVHPDDLPIRGTLGEFARGGPGPRPPAEVRIRHKNGSWRWLEVVPTNLLDDPRVGALVINSRDITERKRAEETKRFLSEVGAALAGSLDYEETLSRIAHMAVPFLADWCIAHTVGEDGRLDRQIIAARDPAVEALQQDSWGQFPPEVDSDHPVVEAVGSGRSRLLSEVTEESRLFVAQNEEHLRLIRRIGTTSWMMVPFSGRMRRLGALSFGLTQHDRRYTEEDLALAEELARRVTLAIENAQLYQELAQRKEQLQDLVGRLLTAHEEERRRVAYDVHDGVAQVAASTYQHLQSYLAHHRPSRPEARHELEAVLALAQRTVREARRVVAGLRPTVLDDLGLATALRHEAETLVAEGWEVAYQHNLGTERLPAPVEITLFRVAQEAIANARKHARTTRLRIELEQRSGGVRLEIRDWGVGFDPGGPRPPVAPGERVGLAGMQERIGLVGGRLDVVSRPGHGARVVAEVPV